MVLSERLETYAQRVRKTKGCPFMALYNSLPKEDQRALDKAWEAQLPVSLIVKALRQEGHKTSQDTIRAHKKGECKCPK